MLHLPNGYTQLIPTGEVIPPGKRAYSPDEHYHICRHNGVGAIKCILMPPGGV